mmetsp:Transcript_12616/g.21956  ORF Transcript_12616/g.21956 Transcript_12616/m.21956 type:complete len:528 (+) Transcript_12616:112-1695(+)
MAHYGGWYKSPGGRWQCGPLEGQDPQQDQPYPLRRNSAILFKNGQDIQQAKRSSSMSAIQEGVVGDFDRTPLNQQKPPAQAVEDSKSQCLERVTTKLREELIAECTRITTERFAVFQQELEESKASARETANTTLTTLEDLSKTSRITNMQLQAELERMQVRSDSARQKSEELTNEVIELRSFCLARGLAGLNSEQQQAVPAFAVEDLREEMRQDHVKTKKCISELVCGIEEVAQALAAKEQVFNKRFDSLKKDIEKLRESGIIPLTPAAAGGTCSSAAWPLMTVKEDDADTDQLEQPAEQPASWEQEFAREVVSMRMQLEYLQGDLSELRYVTTRQSNAGFETRLNAAGADASKEDVDVLQTAGVETNKDLTAYIQDVNGQLEKNIASDDDTADISAIETTVGADDTANSTLQLDEMRSLCSQLQQWYDYEEQRAANLDNSSSSAVAKLSGELTEAKTEVAEALELVHEAVRLGEVLKRDIECERKERCMDVRKLSGRLDSMDKVKPVVAPLMPQHRSISGVPPIA